MSVIVYNEVGTPIIPAGDLAGPVRDALGGALRSMRYVTPDFASAYQDAAGTTPATALGQPVGLMLDRRFGLVRGAELASPLSSWERVGAVSFVGGSISLNNAGPGDRAIGVFAGATGLTFDVQISLTVTSGQVVLRQAFGTIALPAGGAYRATLSRVSASDLAISGGAGGGANALIHSVSLREVPGNHASQPTTTARPTLRSSPLRIDYDGVDDYLRTVFPALGSDVTIARSIPGVGAQILTGQTIAAGNWDDNVTSCATLVIDRALTGPETALVTAFLNQQAGV